MPKKDQPKNEELEKLQKQCEEYLNGWKRARADYENLKKETMKEKENFIKFADLNLLMGLIHVYDNLKLSFKHLPEEMKNNEWIKGIEQIKNQWQDVLKFNGVEEIKVKKGDNFDPEIQEAVFRQSIADNRSVLSSAEQATNEEKNKVKEVLNDGYKLNGRVFKPAKVVVE